MQFRKYRSKKDLLSQVTKEIQTCKVIAKASLKIEYKDGTTAIRYHDTDVLTVDNNGDQILNSGKFRTKTTKERINQYAKGISVYQNKGSWYISIRSELRSVLFYDGIKFDCTGKLLSKEIELDSKRIDSLKKKIKNYIDLLDKAEKIPFPNSGDCWHCLFKDQNQNSLGDLFKDKDHLLNHIKEKYLHGSIILNSLIESGYTNPALIIQMNLKDHCKRSLRKYLTKRLIPDIQTR